MEDDNDYKNRKLHELENAKGGQACRVAILHLIAAYHALPDNSKVTLDRYTAHFLEANTIRIGQKFSPEAGFQAHLLKKQYPKVRRCRISPGGTHFD